jgi:hypothetical protein
MRQGVETGQTLPPGQQGHAEGGEGQASVVVDPRAWFTCSIEGTYTLDWIAKHERDCLDWKMQGVLRTRFARHGVEEG